MEIREYIIELHPDGKVTWAEYEDASDKLKMYREARQYFMDKFDGVCEDALKQMDKKQNRELYRKGVIDAITYLRYYFTR